MWEEMRRVQFPLSRNSETAILWTNQSPSRKNSTTSNSTLTWARGTQFGEGLVLAVHLFESFSPFARNVRPWQHLYSTSQGSNYNKIRLQTLRVKLMEYDQEHRSWSTCREQRLLAVFEIHSFLSEHALRKNCSFSDLCLFCLLSSTKSVQCISLHAKNTNRVIFSSHHVEMTHLNCKTVGQRDLHGLWVFARNLAATQRNFSSRKPQNKSVFSHPKRRVFSHPKIEYFLSLFCKFERFIRFDTWGTAPLQRLC